MGITATMTTALTLLFSLHGATVDDPPAAPAAPAPTADQRPAEGAEATKKNPGACPMAVEVRLIEAPAATWRQAVYRDCFRLARDGRATVWTIEDRIAAKLVHEVLHDERTTIVQFPRKSTSAKDYYEIDSRRPRTFVVDLEPAHTGRGDAKAGGVRPMVETIEEGLSLRLGGAKSADSAAVRVRLDLVSTWVADVACVPPTGADAADTPAMQIPQVVDASVDGDFVIPRGRQILIGLGAANATDREGKAVMMERLALISARAVLTEAEEAQIGRIIYGLTVSPPLKGEAPLPPLPALPPLPPGIQAVSVGPNRAEVFPPAAIGVAMVPATPPMMAEPPASVTSRPSISLKFDPSVRESAFPPAPVGTAMVPATKPSREVAGLAPAVIRAAGLAAIQSGANPMRSGFEPMPIGRSTIVAQQPPALPPPPMTTTPAAPKRDAAVATASFDASPAPVRRPAAPRIDGAVLASGMTQTIRIPLSGKLTIELKARVVPASPDDAARPAKEIGVAY